MKKTKKFEEYLEKHLDKDEIKDIKQQAQQEVKRMKLDMELIINYHLFLDDTKYEEDK